MVDEWIKYAFRLGSRHFDLPLSVDINLMQVEKKRKSISNFPSREVQIHGKTTKNNCDLRKLAHFTGWEGQIKTRLAMRAGGKSWQVWSENHSRMKPDFVKDLNEKHGLGQKVLWLKSYDSLNWALQVEFGSVLVPWIVVDIRILLGHLRESSTWEE